MNTMLVLVTAAQIISALTIIGLVLLQHGKGADMGASFGAGASGSLFGATGSSNFLSKSTAAAAVVFFAATLGLAYLSAAGHTKAPTGGVMENAPPATAIVTPAQTAPTGTAASTPAELAAPTNGKPSSVPAGQANQIPK